MVEYDEQNHLSEYSLTYVTLLSPQSLLYDMYDKTSKEVFICCWSSLQKLFLLFRHGFCTVFPKKKNKKLKM